MNNLSFSHSVSTLLEDFLPLSSNSELSSANSFNLKDSKHMSFGKGLTLHQISSNEDVFLKEWKTLLEKEKMLFLLYHKPD